MAALPGYDLTGGVLTMQVIEHVAAALGKDPRDVKQINFLKPPEQVCELRFCAHGPCRSDLLDCM